MQADAESRVLMRTGNTRPQLEATLTDEYGMPVSLAQATVQVVVDDWTGTELWRNDAVPDPDQGENTGVVTYPWRPEDVATAGNYGLSFHVVFDTGDTADFPAGGPLDFVVADPGTSDLEPFLVDPWQVARRVGVPRATFQGDEVLRDVIADMVADAQTDVETYLGRPVVPTRFTELALANPAEKVGYSLAYDPVVKLVSQDGPDGVTGLWTVTYIAGIKNEIALKAISRYITSAAVEEFRAHPTYGKAYRSVRTLSAGGQSITYDTPGAANRRSAAQLPAFPQPGSPPSIETLARWRRRGVYSRPRYVGSGAGAAGPYSGYVTDVQGEPLFVGDARTGEVWLP